MKPGLQRFLYERSQHKVVLNITDNKLCCINLIKQFNTPNNPVLKIKTKNTKDINLN